MGTARLRISRLSSFNGGISSNLSGIAFTNSIHSRPQWTQDLRNFSQYSEEDLKTPVNHFRKLAVAQQFNILSFHKRSVYRRYSSPKFMEVANIPIFLHSSFF